MVSRRIAQRLPANTGTANGSLSLVKGPSNPRSSPGMSPSKSRSALRAPFFLPGLYAQGGRATLPTGSRCRYQRLASFPRVARFFLIATARAIRARQARARAYLEFHLAGRPSLAPLLSAFVRSQSYSLSPGTRHTHSERSPGQPGRFYHTRLPQPIAP